MHLTRLLAETKENRLLGQVSAESAALCLFIACLLVSDHQCFLFYYLPVRSIRLVATAAENYLEHDGATPGNGKTDFVGRYGRLYNEALVNYTGGHK